jgi:putative flippase GtrA
MKQHAKRIAIYAAVGLTSTAIDIALLWFLLPHMALWLAIATAFAGGTVVNFMLHRWVTFGDAPPAGPGVMARYLSVVAVNLGMTEAITLAAQAWLGWPPIVGKLVSLPLVLVTGYSLSRFWVFPSHVTNK